MTSLVAGEFLKLHTTRTFWILSLSAMALTALFTVAELASEAVTTKDRAETVLGTAGIGGLLMLVLGIVSSAGEYRHGTITSTFLVAPDRRRVLVAKLLANAITGILVTIASMVVLLAIMLPWLSADGESLGSVGLGAADVAGILARTAAYNAITGLLGVGLGVLLTNQVAAIAVVPVILIFVDPLVTLLVDSYDTYSLGGLWASLGGETSEDTGFRVLDPVPAALLYLGYAMAIAAVTAVIAQRRDVS
jgi:ABC-2 type transport system permease protein